MNLSGGQSPLTRKVAWLMSKYLHTLEFLKRNSVFSFFSAFWSCRDREVAPTRRGFREKEEIIGELNYSAMLSGWYFYGLIAVIL